MPSRTKDNDDDGVPSVAEGETVYRRCKQGPAFRNGDRPLFVCFLPRQRPRDEPGISLDRPAISGKSPEQSAESSGKIFEVVQFVVRDTHPLELTVKKLVTSNKAHAVIPELNSIDAEVVAKKLWQREKAEQLSLIARYVFEIAPDGA